MEAGGAAGFDATDSVIAGFDAVSVAAGLESEDLLSAAGAAVVSDDLESDKSEDDFEA